MATANVKRPIIIIGTGRSGSTIFFEAVSHHQMLGWMTNYDGKFPTSRVMACHHFCRRSHWLDNALVTQKPQNKKSRTLRDRVSIRPDECYPKWRELVDEDFSRDYLPNATASVSSRKNVEHFFSSVLHRQGKERLLIKITGPTRMDYLSSLFPDACFVHVKRDACAVINSIVKTGYWKDSMTSPRWNNGLNSTWRKEWEKYDKHPIALVAMQYRAIMTICQSEQSRLGKGQYLEVGYQDFVVEPKATMSRVLNHVNLPPSVDVADYINTPGRYKNMDNKYKDELSSEQIKMIRKIVGEAS